MNVTAIARRLGATRQGQNWLVRCPLDCGYSLSLAEGEDGRLLCFCGGGCEYAKIMLALVKYGLLDGSDGGDRHGDGGHHAHQHGRRDIAKRIAWAQPLYESAAWDERIHVYLGSRGLSLVSPVLRFSAAAPHRLGIRLPAMIAPVVNVGGDLTGVHMTFLRRDGSGKADVPKEYQRECRGVIKGAAIRLAPHDPDTELVIGEGVESTLSAMQLFGRVGWSAIFAGGLKTLELPLNVRRIIIAADHDLSGAGQRNALMAYDRWVAEGRSVCIKTPPIAGQDFNDFLREGGRR